MKQQLLFKTLMFIAFLSIGMTEVFSNDYQPTVDIVDMHCGNDGSVTVNNIDSPALRFLIRLQSDPIPTLPEDIDLFINSTGVFTIPFQANPYNFTVYAIDSAVPDSIFSVDGTVNSFNPIFNITGYDPTCTADGSGDFGQIQIQVTDGQPNYTYNISSTTSSFGATEGPTTNSNHTFVELTPDTYNVEVLSFDGDCIENQQITIAPISGIEADVMVIDPFCSGDIGSIQVTVTEGAEPYTYTLDDLITIGPTVENTITFSNVPIGNHTVAINDANNCTIVLDITIFEPQAIVIGSENSTDISCSASGNVLGSIDLSNITGGTPPYTYRLLNEDNTLATTTSPNPTGPTVNNSISFNGLNIGEYIVVVNDANGCGIQKEYTINTLPLFSITANSTASCVDGVAASINVSGGTGPFVIREYPSGTFVPLNGLPISAGVPERNHQLVNLPFDTSFIYEIQDTATGCLYIETLSAVSQPSEPEIINFDIFRIPCYAPQPLNDGEIFFEISGYDSSVTEVSWEVFEEFTNMSLGDGYSGNATGLTGDNVPVLISYLPEGLFYVIVQEVGGTACPTRHDFEMIPTPIESTIISQTPANSCGTNASVTLQTIGGYGHNIHNSNDGYLYALVTNGAGDPGVYPLTSNVIDLGNIAGDFDIWIMDGNFCTFGPVDVTVTTIPAPILDPLQLFVDDPCTFDNNYTFTAIASGAGELTYQLDNNTPVPGNVSTTEHQFTVTAPGTYTVTVYDENGCPSSSGNITVFEELFVDADFTVEPTCQDFNGEITATVSGGSNFAASPGNFIFVLTGTDSGGAVVGPITQVGAGGNVFTNISKGYYEITVTDLAISPVPSCSEVASITRNTGSIITADIVITQDYRCDFNGSSVTPQLGEISVINPQNGSGSYEYSIDGIDFTNTTGIFTGLTEGTYILYIRDTDTVDCPVNLGEMTIDPLQEVTDLAFATTQVQCPALTSDVTVTAVGTNGATNFEYRIVSPVSITWQTSNVFTAVSMGETYTFEARTTSDGCIYSEDFTIENIDVIELNSSLVSEPICKGDIDGSLAFTITGIDLTSTTYSYYITGGNVTGGILSTGETNSTQNINGLSAGTYTITVTDDITNCTATDIIIITESENPLSFYTVPTESFCGSDTGTILVQAAGGRGNYEYRLEYIDGTVIVDYPNTNPIFTGLVPGVYTVFVRDGNDPSTACEVMNTEIIAELAPPSIALVSGGDTCYDAMDQASQWITITGGEGPYIYILNGDEPTAVTFLGAPAPANTFEIRNLIPGTHEVLVIDNNNCITMTLVFTIQPELTISTTLTKDLDCSVSPDAIIDVVIEGGNGSNILEVNINESGYVSTTGELSFITDMPGTYQFRVTDVEGCVTESNVTTITPVFDPVANAVVNDISCNGQSDGSVTITVDPSVGVAPYEISFNDSTFSNQTEYIGLGAGTYNYQVRDAKQCTITGTVTINESPVITFETTTTPITVEADGMIEINNAAGGTGVFEYELRTSSEILVAYQSTNSFIIATPGTYIVGVRDTNSCEIMQQVVMLPADNQNPITDYADEILFCALTGQSYPVITIENENGEILDLPFVDVLSVVWEKLDDISCSIELDENCPTTDSSCSSDWFEIATGPSCTITETGEYRVVIQFANKTVNSTQTYYFRAKGNTLGVDEIESPKITLTPNPAVDVVEVDAQFEKLLMYDMTGKKVLETSSKSFNVSELQSGIYFVRVINQTGKETVVKLMKR
ncbi:SprB repeat-containing protein [Aquimarina sp. 2201CG5-10]|uniref:SprB repeat-containing protein n=1 Tax=Aquimarina callyspongiae TaxID=3098150 RepID=UPI002AB3D653|nr:T9SS type A sorting domain-containing protein [Aquimarina sp. 2201CG5-10]MDY8138650.1 T9SS type A sorting domain-containing protein [Aquimarina sp. 2201CG5-10]